MSLNRMGLGAAGASCTQLVGAALLNRLFIGVARLHAAEIGFQIGEMLKRTAKLAASRMKVSMMSAPVRLSPTKNALSPSEDAM